MNKIFKVIWSKSRNCYVVASELAKGHTKASSTGDKTKRLALAAITALMLLPVGGYSYAVNTTTVEPVSTSSQTAVEVYTKEGTDAQIEAARKYTYRKAAELDQKLTDQKTSTALHISNSGNLIVGTKENQTVKDMEIRGQLASGSISTGDITSTGNVKVSGKVEAEAVYDDTTKTGNYVVQTHTVGANLDALDTQVKANADAINEEAQKRKYSVTNLEKADAAEAAAREAADTEIKQAMTNQKTSTALHISSSGDLIVGTKENQTVKDMEIRGQLASGSISTGDITSTGNVKVSGKVEAEAVYDDTTKTGNYVVQTTSVGANLSALDTQVKSNADAIEEEARKRKYSVTNLENADKQLQTNIDNEAAAREAKDNELNERITSEANAIHETTNKLQDDLNTETADRKAADTALDDKITAETSARVAADAKLVEAFNSGLSLSNDNVLQKNTTTIDAQGNVTTSKTDANEMILNKGKDNQITLNEQGIKVGTNSSVMDANGVYTGGDTYDAAKAALKSDGSIKGADGKFTVNSANGTVNVNDQIELNGATGVVKSNGLNVGDGNMTVNNNGNIKTIGTLSVADGNFKVNGNGGVSAAGGKTTLASDGSIKAADGKFTVNSNGGVKAADGKITLSSDGSVKAADGKFTVNSNGAVKAADGKFTVNSDGAIKGADGKFIVDSNGNLKTAGTLSAADGSFKVDSTGKITSTGLDAGNGTIQTTGTVQAGDVKTGTLETTGDATIGGNLTVDKNLTVNGTFDAKTLSSTLDANNYTTITGGKIQSVNLKRNTATGETQASASTFDETGSNTWARDDDSIGRSTLTADSISQKLSNTGDNPTAYAESTMSQGTDNKYTMTDTVKDGDKINVASQSATESSNVITEGTGDSAKTSTFQQRVDEILNQINSSDTVFSKIDQKADNITNEVKNGDNSTSTTQSAKDITNTAKQGAITNEAQNLVNKASDTISNEAANDITNTSTNGNISNTANNGTISNTAKNIENTASENITNTAKNGSITNDAKNIANIASETLSNSAKNITNTTTDNMTNTIGKNLTTTVGGDMSTEVTGNQSNTVKGTLTETVTGKVTEDYKSDLDTKIGGNEIHAVTGNQTVTVSKDRTVNVKGTETENFNAQVTSIKTDQKTSVGGNQTNIVAGNQQNTVSGSKTETVKGSVTEKYGSQATTVDGDQSTNVGGSQSNVVAGNQTNTISGSKTESVKGAVTETYGSQSTTVNGNQSNTVKGTLTETVTGDVTEDYKANLSTTVGGNQTTTVTGDSSLSAKNINNTATEKLSNSAKDIENKASKSILNQVGENTSWNMTDGTVLESIKGAGGQTNTITDTADRTVQNVKNGSNELTSTTSSTNADLTITNGNSAYTKVNTATGNKETVKEGENLASTNLTKDGFNVYAKDENGHNTIINNASGTTQTIQTDDEHLNVTTKTVGTSEEKLTSGSSVIDVLKSFDDKGNPVATSSVTDGTNTSEVKQTASEVATSAKDITNTASEKITNQIGDGSKVKSEMTADGITNTAKGGTIYNKSKDILNEASGDILNFADGEIGNVATKITNITGDTTVTSDTKGTTFENKVHNTAIKEGTVTKTTISGNTIETGQATMDYADVMKDLGVRGNATVDGDTTLGKEGADTKLTVNSKSTFKDTVKLEKTLEVDGTSTFNDKVTVTKGGLDVNGGTTTDTLHVTSTSIFDGAATFKDAVTMEKDLRVRGNATVDGSMTASSYKVDGKTYIDSNGINANKQKVVNVAPGRIAADSKDAVNGSQLYQTNERVTGVENKVNKLDSRVDKVGANAAALANLHPLEFDADSKWNIAAAVGGYKGETATAIGAFYRPNENVMVNVSSSFGTGENMYGGGISLRIGQGGNKARRNATNGLTDREKAMQKQIDSLTNRLDALLSVINPNMSKDFPDVPENHWAYEAVSRLAGNGVIQGYEDGKYHGDRTMTRYEMAEIIYNALSKGAKAEKKLVEEFKPELQAMAAQKKA